MSFIEAVINGIKNFFKTKTPAVENTGESWVCVFLRHEEDFLFIQDGGGLWDLKPLMIKTDVMNTVENSTERIGKLLYDEFEILGDKIQFDSEVISLYPILNKRYVFAVVDLSNLEFEELRLHMKTVALPVINLHADANLFFNLLQKVLNS